MSVRCQPPLAVFLFLFTAGCRAKSDHHLKASAEPAACSEDILQNAGSALRFPERVLGGGRLYSGEFYDTILILDSSSSIGKLYFQKALRALQDLTREAPWDTHFAIVTVATHCAIVVNFTSGKLAAEQLGKLSRSGGKTNLQGALKLSRTMYMDPQYGSRFGSFKRILLFSDGKSNIRPQKTFTNAIDLRLMGVEIFVVAHSDSYFDETEDLKYIASSVDAHLYRLGEIGGFVKHGHVYDRTWPAHAAAASLGNR